VAAAFEMELAPVLPTEGVKQSERATGRLEILCPTEISVEPGQIAYLIGPSGSGKTQVLGALRRTWPGVVVAGCLGEPPDASSRPILDLFGGTCNSALRWLCLAGLAEPRLWFAPARCLSAGQADRLALALLFARAEGAEEDAGTPGRRDAETGGKTDAARTRRRDAAREEDAGTRGRGDAGRGEKRRPVVVLIDEFGSRLDRVTAAVLARNLRRWVYRQNGNPLSPSPSSSRRGRGSGGVCVVVATAHDDLVEPLAADWVWVKTADGTLGVLHAGGKKCQMPSAKWGKGERRRGKCKMQNEKCKMAKLKSKEAESGMPDAG
jgi:hypothetical protein